MSEKKTISEGELDQNIPVFEKNETPSENTIPPYFNIRNFNPKKRDYQYAAKATLSGKGFAVNSREAFPNQLNSASQDK